MKKIIGIIVIILLVATILPATGNIVIDKIPLSIKNSNTLYVGGSGSNNYTKIQDAINDSTNGDTVFVFDDNSPYYENIRIMKSINLIGENKNSTIIDGYENGEVIFVTANMVTISGFTIMNGSDEPFSDCACVHISADSVTISNNIIKDSYYGIAIWNEDEPFFDLYEHNIHDNIISSNEINGIWLCFCKDSTIINNIIFDNNFSGIHTNFACNNIISGNKISSNENGITLFQDSRFNEISINNIKNNKNFGIYISESGLSKILKNNFIGNGQNAKFMYKIKSMKLNIWNGNYWEKPRTKPFLVPGKLCIWAIFGILYWFEIDWHPAQEPYDI